MNKQVARMAIQGCQLMKKQYDEMVSWQTIMTSKSKAGKIENLRNCKLMKWEVSKLSWHRKVKMTKGTVDETASWQKSRQQDGKLMKWQVDNI